MTFLKYQCEPHCCVNLAFANIGNGMIVAIRKKEASTWLMSLLMRDIIPRFSGRNLWKSFVFKTEGRYFTMMYIWIIGTTEGNLS